MINRSQSTSGLIAEKGNRRELLPLDDIRDGTRREVNNKRLITNGPNAE